MSITWDWASGNYGRSWNNMPTLNGNPIPPGFAADYFLYGQGLSIPEYIEVTQDSMTYHYPEVDTSQAVVNPSTTDNSFANPMTGDWGYSTDTTNTTNTTTTDETSIFNTQSALKGASTGLSIAGPVGAAVGGLIGGFGETVLNLIKGDGEDTNTKTTTPTGDIVFNRSTTPDITGGYTSVGGSYDVPLGAYNYVTGGGGTTSTNTAGTTTIPTYGGTGGSSSTGRVIAPTTRTKPTTGNIFGPDVRNRVGRRSTVYAGSNYKKGDVFIPTLIGS